MPTWLLRALPAIALALGVALIARRIDRHGYDRAMATRDARDAAMLAAIRTELRQSEARLGATLNDIEDQTVRLQASIAQTRAAIQPTLAKEIAREKRLADPALGLTPGVLAAVNRARTAGACATAAPGRPGCALSAASDGH